MFLWLLVFWPLSAHFWFMVGANLFPQALPMFYRYFEKHSEVLTAQLLKGTVRPHYSWAHCTAQDTLMTRTQDDHPFYFWLLFTSLFPHKMGGHNKSMELHPVQARSHPGPSSPVGSQPLCPTGQWWQWQRGSCSPGEVLATVMNWLDLPLVSRQLLPDG